MSSHNCWPYQPDTFTSKASSPENEIRQTRAAMPEASTVSRKVMNPKLSFVTSRSGGIRPTTRPGRRPPDRDGGPLLGDRGEVDVQLGPLGLAPLLQPVQDAGGPAG